MSTFFRIPDWRAAMAELALGATDPAIPLRTRLAPPVALLQAARRLVQGSASLWVPDRLARSGEVVSENGQVIAPQGEGAWIFFCDDAPGNGWGHPCRYFVLRVGEAPVIVSASAPPRETLNSVGFVEDRPARRFLFRG